jgi:hypothetical protein
MSGKINYQKVIIWHRCNAPMNEENKCVGFSIGSHGDCDYRGSGNDYHTCHNPEVLKNRRTL